MLRQDIILSQGDLPRGVSTTQNMSSTVENRFVTGFSVGLRMHATHKYGSLCCVIIGTYHSSCTTRTILITLKTVDVLKE